MDEDQIMRQETQQGSSDGFLEGWEETGPGSEEPGLEENGEVQTGSSAESQDVESGGEQGTEAAASAKDVSGEREQYGEGSEESEPPAGKEPPPAPPPKTWTMDYMGQPVTISEADVPVLAQKALDYDRIRASYDEARPVMDLFRGFAQRAGLSVQEYVGRLRTQAKQMEGMDERAALQAVEMEDREARVAAQEAETQARQEAQRRAQAAQSQRQHRINADIQEFIAVFPNAALDFKSIPQEVWDAVNGGMSLVAAYARYSGAQTNAAQKAEEERQRQEAVQRQNAQNAAASAGSMKSAGQNHGPKDPFLEGWDE